MSTVWIIIIVVAVLVLIGLAVVVTRRKQQEQGRQRAGELRAQAAAGTEDVHRSDLQAREAEAQAEQARVQAEQAEARAADVRRDQQHDEATVEGHAREADRIDPDVDPQQSGPDRT